MKILYYLKRYPFSIVLIGVVAYLSFFRPPSLNKPLFEGFDKVVHFLMYAGVSGMLWIEFLFNHRRNGLNIRHGIVGAVVCPILFGGGIELGQQYLTWYRSGDWRDFLANTLGVLAATLVARYILTPLILRKRSND